MKKKPKSLSLKSRSSNKGYYPLDIKKGTSVFTICKNRNENFEKALSTWVKYQNIDEIVVVDWNSDTPLKRIVNKYQNGKVKLLEVNESVKFSRSVALNLAARFTSYDKILRLDADIQLLQDFVEKHPLDDKGCFYTGHWKNARNKNELALFGIIYVHREHFFKVNGVSEYLEQYGWEDSDLYDRLEAMNLQRLHINYDTVYHIEHESRSSYNNKITQDMKASDELKSFYTTMVNKKISEAILPWTLDCKMLDYSIVKADEQHYKCDPIGPKTTIISEENYEKAERLTLIDFISWDTGFDPLSEDNPYKECSKEELLKIYIILREIHKVKSISNGINLLFFYDANWNLSKKINSIYSMYKNIQNSAVGSIHAFIKESSDIKDGLFNAFASKYQIIVTELSEAPTFEFMIDYSNEYLGEQKNIILNENVYWDNSLEKLLSFDFTEKFLVLTAQNKDNEQTLYPYINNLIPNYYTAQSFAFSTPFKTDVYLKFKINDPLLIPLLLGQLSMSGYAISNPSLEVKSYRSCDSNSQFISFDEWSDIVSSVHQPKYGIVWSKLKSTNSEKNALVDWNLKNLIVKIKGKEDLSILKNIVKTAELYDRNVWIVNDGVSNNFKNILETICNSNVNFISPVDLTSSFIEIYEKGSFDNILSDQSIKNIYLETNNFPDKLNKYEYIGEEKPVPEFKISIITPSFNSAKMIDFAIQSVLLQGYDNFEHIVVDGGSTDGTVDILKKYPHLKWISEKDKGQSDAMNKGFKMASGDIIAYLNADDAFLPSAFKKAIQYFSAGAEVVMGNVKVTKEDGSYWINESKYKHVNVIKHWEHQAFCVNPVGYFYLKGVQERIGGYNEDNHLTMDLEFLMSVSQKFLITKVNDLFGVFRNFGGTKTVESSSSQNIWNEDFFYYVSKYIKELPASIALLVEQERKDGYRARAVQNVAVDELDDNQKYINQLLAELVQKESIIQEKESIIQEKESIIQEKESIIQEKEIIIADNLQKNHQKEWEIIKLNQDLKERQQYIDSHEQKINELKEHIKALEIFYEPRLHRLEYDIKAQQVDMQIKDSKIEELASYIQLLKGR